MLRRVSRQLACLLAVIVLVSGLQAGPDPQPQEFSNAIATKLLDQMTEGFIAHNQQEVLSVFDHTAMPNYAGFRDQIETLFAKYVSFRAAYRLRQSWNEGGHGIVMVEFELEGTPIEEGSPALRRSAQLRFEFARNRNGWKIVDLNPRGSFS